MNSQKKQHTSRWAYIFSLIFLAVLLSLTIILYSYMVTIQWWTPSTLNMIDQIYLVIRNLLITIIITNIIGLVFREIVHSGAIENLLIRRFIPIVRFFIISSVWIISAFHICEDLQINTSNFIAGAGIGWVIFALAAKDIVANLFGSLSVLLGQIYDIGEIIRMRGSKWTYEGLVEEITLNYTRITNKTGEVVYIPNRTIYTEVIENISRQRYKTYSYLIPFNKTMYAGADIQNQLRIIEGKILEYDPLLVEWEMENPNAGDFMYRVTIRLPYENTDFDRDIREFLADYIFYKKGVN